MADVRFHSSVRLPSDLCEALAAHASSVGYGVSGLVRRICEEWVAEGHSVEEVYDLMFSYPPFSESRFCQK